MYIYPAQYLRVRAGLPRSAGWTYIYIKQHTNPSGSPQAYPVPPVVTGCHPAKLDVRTQARRN